MLGGHTGTWGAGSMKERLKMVTNRKRKDRSTSGITANTKFQYTKSSTREHRYSSRNIQQEVSVQRELRKEKKADQVY